MVRGNRGQVLVLVALAIVVLLVMAALAIDVGFMYTTRHELQRSADAGALAGASALRDYGKDCKELTPNADGTITALGRNYADCIAHHSPEPATFLLFLAALALRAATVRERAFSTRS